MIHYINLFIQEMWALCMEMAPYLLLGMFVSGLISIFIDNSFVTKHIGQKNIFSIFKSTLFGIPLPLCSCGVIPVAATLRESGASKGSTVSFLVSTPQTGVDSILLTYGMLGPIFAFFRPLAALISGMFSGIVINHFDKGDHSPAAPSRSKSDEPFQKKVFHGFKYGFISLPSDIVVPLFQGLLVAAAIALFIPPDLIAEYFSSNTYLQYLMMLLVSLPVYVCATASIPIALALLIKGITPGAVFVFLMAGPATNASSIAVIKNILGRKTLYRYLSLIGFTALLFGIFLDTFLTIDLSKIVGQHQGHEMSGPWTIILTFIFLAILTNAYISRFRPTGKSSKKIVEDLEGQNEQINFNVIGMTCSHCKESVEGAVHSVPGVEQLTVDLLSGKVQVEGKNIDKSVLIERIESKGFSIKD